MDATQVTLIVGAVGSVLAFFGTVANMINANFKEARARRWALEDKEQLAKETHAAKEDLARQTRHAIRNTDNLISINGQELRTLLAALHEAGNDREKKLSGMIADNTIVSEKAFKEANDVNRKLLALGKEQVGDKIQNVQIVNEKPIPVHDKHNDDPVSR